MKKMLVLAFALAFGLVAHATNKPPVDPPAPKPPVIKVPTKVSNKNTAAAQTETTIGDVAPHQSTDITGDFNKGYSLFLPVLASTPPIGPIAAGQCAVRIDQKSAGVMFGALSFALGGNDPSFCNMMEVRNAKAATCQFASAHEIEDLLVARELKAYQIKPSKWPDMGPEDCARIQAALREPEVTQRQEVRYYHIYEPPTFSAAEPPAGGTCPAVDDAPKDRPKTGAQARGGSKGKKCDPKKDMCCKA